MRQALDDEILKLIAAGVGAPADDAQFDALALELFAHQYARGLVLPWF